MSNEDAKLDALLNRLKEPMPAAVLETVWGRIEGRLSYREGSRSGSLIRLFDWRRMRIPAAAASLLFCAFFIGQVMMKGESREYYKASGSAMVGEATGPDSPAMFGVLPKKELEGREGKDDGWLAGLTAGDSPNRIVSPEGELKESPSAIRSKDGRFGGYRYQNKQNRKKPSSPGLVPGMSFAPKHLERFVKRGGKRAKGGEGGRWWGDATKSLGAPKEKPAAALPYSPPVDGKPVLRADAAKNALKAYRQAESREKSRVTRRASALRPTEDSKKDSILSVVAQPKKKSGRYGDRKGRSISHRGKQKTSDRRRSYWKAKERQKREKRILDLAVWERRGVAQDISGKPIPKITTTNKLNPPRSWDKKKVVGKTPNVPPRQLPRHNPLKIIKTAQLTVEVKKFRAASDRIDAIVTRYRGLYADHDVRQDENGVTSARIVVRVPQENFERCYAEFKQLGRVEAEKAWAEDVTAQFSDLSARIRNQEYLEKRLLVLLEEKRRGDKMSDILAVEQRIAQVREKIETMKGRMRVMADKISLGTIHLNIHEPKRVVPSGTLSIEVKDAAASDHALDALAKSVNGQIVARNTSRNLDGTRIVTATLKAPMPRFGDLVEGVKALGRVDKEQVRGFNTHAIQSDPGAGSVMATLHLTLFEKVSQTPGGVANIEVQTQDQAAKTIGELLKQNGGSLISRQERLSNGAAHATYRLRLPRKNFARMVLSLDQIGRVVNKQMHGVDVVAVVGPVAEIPCEMTITLFERTREVPAAAATISSTDLDKSATAIKNLLQSVQGHVQSHAEHRQPDGRSGATYVLQTRRVKFQALLDGLETIGRVENRQVRGMDLGEVQGAAADAMCSLRLTVNQRRAPVPSAKLALVVEKAKDAADELKRLRKDNAAETMGVEENLDPQGNNVQTWRFRVAVAKFHVFVEGIQKLGRVRTKNISGVGSGMEEKPDPKALASVMVTVTQRGPYASPEEESTGSITGALRLGGKWVYKILAMIVLGLTVMSPFIVIALIFWGARKLSRPAAGAVTGAVAAPPTADEKQEEGQES